MIHVSSRVPKTILYAIGIALDVSGVLVAIAFPEYGTQLSGVALILIGVYVMRIAKRLGARDARDTSGFNRNGGKNVELKRYAWMLFAIALVIILSSIVVGIFGALDNSARMSSISYFVFAIGVILLTVVVGQSRLIANTNSRFAKTAQDKRKRVATIIEISSIVVCILAFVAWHQNLFRADRIGWPVYLTITCVAIFVIASGYKAYLSFRNMWPR